MDVSSLTSLLGTNWELSSLAGIGNLGDSFKEGLPQLNFSNDGRISGTDGCNNISGGVTAEDLAAGKLDLSKLASTRRACGDDNGSNALQNAFQNTSSFNLKDNKLQLLSAGQSVLAEYIQKK